MCWEMSLNLKALISLITNNIIIKTHKTKNKGELPIYKDFLLPNILTTFDAFVLRF